MKKTIALLLATATAAFSATQVDLEWNNNTADLTGSGFSMSTGVTVAYTLNFANIQPEHLFYFQDENGNGSGMGGDFYGGSTCIGAWMVDSYGGGYDYNILDYEADELLYNSGATYMSIVYSLQYVGSKYSVREDLYMWDSSGNLVASGSDASTPTSTQLTFGNFKDININSNYISSDGIDVYSGIMSEDEREAAALAVLRLSSGDNSNENMPEPTTSTLSLLALAGLAARRRRR